MDELVITALVFFIMYTAVVVIVVWSFATLRRKPMVNDKQDSAESRDIVEVLRGRDHFHHPDCHHMRGRDLRSVAKHACANCCHVWKKTR